MQALVLGGTGNMGQGVARDLVKQEQIKKVILGDIKGGIVRRQWLLAHKFRNTIEMLRYTGVYIKFSLRRAQSINAS